MMTVNEVCKLTGVSIRTLQYYDSIGLLPPAQRTEAGYRLYDDAALERLSQILLFRELEFPLTEIKSILDDPGFDRTEALTQQIELLTLKIKRLGDIVELARDQKQKLIEKGEINMDFKAFDTAKIDEYTKRAKEKWGGTKEYKEYNEKHADSTSEEKMAKAEELMKVFAEFGTMKDKDVSSDEVQAQVEKLRACISANYYDCSPEILGSLGQMYTADKEFSKNIDAAGGNGTAEFVSRAIGAYVNRR